VAILEGPRPLAALTFTGGRPVWYPFEEGNLQASGGGVPKTVGHTLTATVPFMGEGSKARENALIACGNLRRGKRKGNSKVGVNDRPGGQRLAVEKLKGPPGGQAFAEENSPARNWS